MSEGLLERVERVRKARKHRQEKLGEGIGIS